MSLFNTEADSLVDYFDFSVIRGTQGNDTIQTPTTGNWLIYALSGDDNVRLNSAGRDIVYGGEGNDTLTSSSANDALYGEAGNDVITAGSSGFRPYDARNMYIDGGIGDDHVNFAGTNGTILLGDGNDIANVQAYRLSGQPSPVLEKLRVFSVDGGDGEDEITAINRLTRDAGVVDGGAGNDTIVTKGNVWVNGGSGDDTIRSDSENVFVIQRHQGNRIEGGDGNDDIWHRAKHGTFTDTIDGGAGDDAIHAEGANVLVYGGAGNDNLSAYSIGGVPVKLFGEEGNDSLYGSVADGEWLDGGAGNDLLVSTYGSSVLTGGKGSDVFRFSAEWGTMGHDVITDFTFNERIQDNIEFRIGNDLDFSKLIFTQEADGTLISFDASIGLPSDRNTIKLVGVDVASITKDMFTFA